MSYSKTPEDQWDSYLKSELGQAVTIAVGFHTQLWLFEMLGFMSWWNHSLSISQACIWQTLPTLFSWQSQSRVLLLLPLADHMICTWAELEHAHRGWWILATVIGSESQCGTLMPGSLLRGFLFLEGHKSTNVQWDSRYIVWRRSQTAVGLMPHRHRIMKLWHGFFEHENTTLAFLLKSAPVKCWLKTLCLRTCPCLGDLAVCVLAKLKLVSSLQKKCYMWLKEQLSNTLLHQPVWLKILCQQQAGCKALLHHTNEL